MLRMLSERERARSDHEHHGLAQSSGWGGLPPGMAQATAVATARTAPPINIESPPLQNEQRPDRLRQASTSEEEGPTGAGMTFERVEKEEEEGAGGGSGVSAQSIEQSVGSGDQFACARVVVVYQQQFRS